MADEEVAAEADDTKPARDAAQKAREWIAEIKGAEKSQAKWIERGKKIEKLYADERDGRTDRARRFNILWSNVETTRPAVYMQTPKIKAQRRYRDRDPVARLAGVLIERVVQASCELYDFDWTIDQCVRDRLLPGRGQAWVFYAPSFVGQGDQQMLEHENVVADYVPWTRFLHSRSSTWEEVWWVSRDFFKSRAELKTWLKERKLTANPALIAMDVSSDSDKVDDGEQDDRAKARICEIWNKRDGTVLYVAPGSGVNAILGETPPPVRFRDFFPCPRPLLATTTSKGLIPIPDYALYQDQAQEIDDLTKRIGSLQKALKVVGLYDAGSKAVADLLEGSDTKMIPVEGWAMFKEGGGTSGKVEWFPVQVVAETLKLLLEVREQAKQTLYEVSGLGDILRGATDPNETATAQGIKAKWGSLRIRRTQKDVQRFAADLFRLKAEVVSEAFSMESILAMAGADAELLAKFAPPPPPAPEIPPQMQQIAQQNPQLAQQAQQALAQQAEQAKQKATMDFIGQVEKLLRDDTARSFRIDVETDSTLEPDQTEEKQAAIEFATSIGMFLEKSAPLIAQGPEAAKLVGEMLLFVTRRFEKADTLEQAIEQAMEAAAKPKPPAPDPEMVKAEAKKEETHAKIQGAKELQAVKIDGMQQETQAKIQGKMIETIAGAQVKQAQGQMMMEQTAQQHEQSMHHAEAEGEHKMSIAERAQQAKLAMQEGAPPVG